MQIKVKLDDFAQRPTRAHKTDAGLDLYAPFDVEVPANGSVAVDTGVHVELPIVNVGNRVLCTVGMIKSKSGLNVHHGITSEGVIDVGYTGSMVVKLYNHTNKAYQIKKGDKISQLVIMPIFTPDLQIVDELSKTERGTGGFGSTGR